MTIMIGDEILYSRLFLKKAWLKTNMAHKKTVIFNIFPILELVFNYQSFTASRITAEQMLL